MSEPFPCRWCGADTAVLTIGYRDGRPLTARICTPCGERVTFCTCPSLPRPPPEYRGSTSKPRRR